MTPYRLTLHLKEERGLSEGMRIATSLDNYVEVIVLKQWRSRHDSSPEGYQEEIEGPRICGGDRQRLKGLSVFRDIPGQCCLMALSRDLPFTDRPNRKGYRGQSGIVQALTSSDTYPTHSRHMARMALSGLETSISFLPVWGITPPYLFPTPCIRR